MKDYESGIRVEGCETRNKVAECRGFGVWHRRKGLRYSSEA